MERCKNIDELVDYSVNKITRTKENISLRPLITTGDLKTVVALTEDINSNYEIVDNLKEALMLRKHNLANIKKQREVIRELTKKADFALCHIPTSYPVKGIPLGEVETNSSNVACSDTATSVKGKSSKTQTSNGGRPTASAAVNKNRLVKPMPEEILALTLTEYKELPSYLKGRILYEAINSTITKLNKVFQAKYTIMNSKKSALTTSVKKLISDFKENDLETTKGLFYIVEADVKYYSSLKLDRVILSHIAILRHCSRVKEIRGKKLIRYALL